MLRDKFSKLDMTPMRRGGPPGRNQTAGPTRLAQRGRVRPDATPMPVAYPVAVNWMRKRDRSLLSNLTSLLVCGQSAGTTQGASTLTMQYVRLAIEYSATSPQDVVDATSDTPGRKIREMRYALALEKQLSKQQILERYLNLVPFGGGAFGIYAASQVFFNKAPKDLTLPE